MPLTVVRGHTRRGESVNAFAKVPNRRNWAPRLRPASVSDTPDGRSLALPPAIDEFSRRHIDGIRVKGAQEVLSAFDDAKLSAGAVDESFISSSALAIE
jgi:hypothetical protein